MRHSTPRSRPFSMFPFPFLLLYTLFLVQVASAYKPLSEPFLRNISSGGNDFDPKDGALLAPILRSRVPGTDGHVAVQRHFVDFFSTELPKWKSEWVNSTSKTATGGEVPIANLVLQREPPWTKEGQANWLTLAAHYDSKNAPAGFVGAMDSAVPCSILMHVARSIDGFMTQMHDEMAELGEGGTVEMDMGVRILFLDGKESLDGDEPALYGSRSLADHWETSPNPVGSKYPNSLNQISIFVLLDILGGLEPSVPSYFPTTHWTYRNIANLESRLRTNNLLETKAWPSTFFQASNGVTAQAEPEDDYLPFMERGVPCLHILPSPIPLNRHTLDDDGANLHMPTVRDWAKIMTGFALEWLDMMEVWPE